LKYREAEDSAATDFLTTLPNKRAFAEVLNAELARARRLNQSFALLVCDLDDFKLVNDRFGHLVGDKVLQAVALRLKADCREYESVARVGGDEFAFILPGFRRESLPNRVGRLTQVAVDACRDVCGQPLLSLSIGEAFHPDDGVDAATLIAAADRRMYQIKRRYKLQAGGAAADADPEVIPDSALKLFVASHEYAARQNSAT
jgi:diguanylate cyclase (GGDEF)-like protein